MCSGCLGSSGSSSGTGARKRAMLGRASTNPAIRARVVVRQLAMAATSAPARSVLVLNGKGLDTRGTTEESRAYFGSTAILADYDRIIRKTAEELGVGVEHLQTNDLEECISCLKSSTADAIVINPAGFMAEQALVDCIAALRKPVLEVHYGNFFAKGKVSLVTASCSGLFCGAKLDSYAYGMRAAVAALEPSYCEFDYQPPS